MIIGFRWLNGKRFTIARLQWQPTLTAHDPNPPMTLEDVPTPPEPPGEAQVGWRSLLSVGL